MGCCQMWFPATTKARVTPSIHVFHLFHTGGMPPHHIPHGGEAGTPPEAALGSSSLGGLGG